MGPFGLLYCFYNSWRGGWPKGVQRYDGANRYDPPEEELQLYGCAAVDAWSVRQILVGGDYSNRRTLRNSYLPVSRPWSMIFADPAIHGPREAMVTLSSWMPGRRQIPPALPPGEGEDTESEGMHRHNRLDVYRDSAPISTPPQYVLDLLQDGEIQPRRLKPLARRVAILPGLA